MILIKTTFLSAKDYPDSNKNYGDCILVDNESELVIFDCGSEEHACRVLDYMAKHNYTKAKLVLSHNDADHFNGIPYLLDHNALSEVYTMLLFKYKDELYDLVGDKRRNGHSIIEHLSELFDNIYSLSGRVTLKDVFQYTSPASGISIAGPSKKYALEAVAKLIDSREGDTIDSETIVNAVSIQVSVDYGPNKRLLLTGDSSYAAIKDSIRTHCMIQLPHHGKLAQAEEILNAKGALTAYFVSDNTGSSNGGSDDLRRKYPKGYNIRYTNDGDQTCTASSDVATKRVGSYFLGGL